MTGAAHGLAQGALLQRDAALHVAVIHDTGISISTQLAALRHLLSGSIQGALGEWFGKVREVSLISALDSVFEM